MTKPKWMEDPAVHHIPQEKLDFLSNLVDGGQGKNQKEIMMYFMTAMKKAQSAGLSFTPSEIQTIITTIKKYSSPEELEKINDILKKAPH